MIGSLDTRTVVCGYVISNVLCTIVVALLWVRNRSHFAGIGFWLADFALQTLALVLAILRGLLPDFISIVLPNALVLAGTILMLMGLERFVGKRARQLHNYLLLAAFFVLHTYFTFVQPSQLNRTTYFSLALVLVFAQSTWLMFGRTDPELRPATRGVGLVFVAAGLLATIRVVLDLILNPGNDLFQLDPSDTFYLLANQMLFIALTFGLALMVNRRLLANMERDLAQRIQAEEALDKAELQYRSLVEESLQGILIYQDNRVVFTNQAQADSLGYSKQELAALSPEQFSQLIHPQDRALVFSRLEDELAGKPVPSAYEFRVLRKDGGASWHQAVINQIEYRGRPAIQATSMDISEHKRLEEALKTSQSLAQGLYESAPDALITVDARGRITQANGQAQSMFGYNADELSGQPIELLIPKDLRGKHKQNRRGYFRKPRRRAMGSGLELSALRKDGSTFPVEIELSPLQVGAEIFVTADIRDISERKQIDQALKYRTNVLAALHQVTLDLVNRHEMNDILQTLLIKIGALLDASDISFDLVENDDTLVTYAVTSEQPLEKGDRMRRGEGGWLSWQAIDSGQPAVLEDYASWEKRRPLYEGYPIHAIMIIPIHHGARTIGAINISRSTANKPFNDSDVYVAQQLAQMAALVLDNAELYAQLQSKLSESVSREAALHQAQAQVIEQQRTMATFEERQRMARDLHDSVNQSIHSLVLFSETLVSALEKDNPGRARQISESLQESARQALKETRLLLYQTQASVEEKDINLVDELNARLAAVELRAGIRAQIVLEGSLQHCPDLWHENLFWITIEALNNSIKHAQARKVKIIIRSFKNYIELEVIDDGRGFDASRPRGGGYGLRNMQERADLLGGRLTVTSTPGKGTGILFRAEIEAPR